MVGHNMVYKMFAFWLKLLCALEKPEPDITAYYLGLFESPTGVIAYLVGSKVFDEEDSDWACYEDFVPKIWLKYHLLIGSQSMKWNEVQTLVESILNKFLNDPKNKKCFLREADAIAVGFDDGDLEVVYRKES